MKNWHELVGTLLRSNVSPVCLFGPPGTGKSTAPEAILGKEEVVRVQCTSGTDLVQLIGMPGLRDGKTIQHTGPALRALTHGLCLVLDEADKLSPDMSSLLQALADDIDLLQISDLTGNIHRAKPGYRLILTTNAPDPVSAFPEPVSDRIRAFVPCLAPCESAMEKLDIGMRKLCASKYGSLDLKQWAFAVTPSFRKFLTVQLLLGQGVEMESAFTLVFGTGGKEMLSAFTSANV